MTPRERARQQTESLKTKTYFPLDVECPVVADRYAKTLISRDELILNNAGSDKLDKLNSDLERFENRHRMSCIRCRTFGIQNAE